MIVNTDTQQKKPLGKKAYGSIPHLPGSRLGPGDHKCSEGQARICLEQARDRHDVIVVQEKLDGSCVSVAKIDGVIVPLTRAGYHANSSPYEQHHMFAGWVYQNYERFLSILVDGERICGEWLAQAHGTRYQLTHEPFVAFDLMAGDVRYPYTAFKNTVEKAGIITPRLIHMGGPISLDAVLAALEPSGHGALDPVEGAVWRVERRNVVDYLCKYVRHDKADGCYLESVTGKPAVWNWKP